MGGPAYPDLFKKIGHTPFSALFFSFFSLKGNLFFFFESDRKIFFSHGRFFYFGIGQKKFRVLIWNRTDFFRAYLFFPGTNDFFLNRTETFFPTQTRMTDREKILNFYNTSRDIVPCYFFIRIARRMTRDRSPDPNLQKSGADVSSATHMCKTTLN